MKRPVLTGLAAGLLLSTAGMLGAGENPPEDPKLPAAGYRMLQSYRQLSGGFLDKLEALLAVKDGDPRQTPKERWGETGELLTSAFSQYLQEANAYCVDEKGAGGLPLPVLEWSTAENVRISAILVEGEQLFHTRNAVARTCYDMEVTDLSAFAEKKMALWELAGEIDREYQRLSAQKEKLGSLSRQQLEADQKACMQAVFKLSALLAKCRDLEKDMKDWYKGLFTPADLKSKIDFRLSQLVFDKDTEPTFHGQVEKWKVHLEAWQKKYAAFHRDCGAMVESWAKQKENFRGHAKILEGLTYDEMDSQVLNALKDMANRITGELSGRR